MADRNKWAEERLEKMRQIAHMSDHELSQNLARMEQDHADIEADYPEATASTWLLLLREAACRRLMTKEVLR
jgi:hypothetical protein